MNRRITLDLPCWIVFVLSLFSIVVPRFAQADLPQTRASNLSAVAVGMGKVMHLSEYLHDYPGGRTAFPT